MGVKLLKLVIKNAVSTSYNYHPKAGAHAKWLRLMHNRIQFAFRIHAIGLLIGTISSIETALRSINYEVNWPSQLNYSCDSYYMHFDATMNIFSVIFVNIIDCTAS